MHERWSFGIWKLFALWDTHPQAHTAAQKRLCKHVHFTPPMLLGRTFVLSLAVAQVHGMAFGMRTLGRRLMMSATSRGQGRGTLYNDVTETIGNTPIVKISDKREAAA